MATPITKTIMDIPIKAAGIEVIKNALSSSNKNTKFIFKTLDGKFYEIVGTIKPAKP